MDKPKKSRFGWLRRLGTKDIRVEHGDLELVDEPPGEIKKHWLRRRTSWATLLVLPLALVAWLVTGIFLSKIELGNKLYSARQSTSELESIIKAEVAKYSVTLRYPDGKKSSYSLSEMGYAVETSATVKDTVERAGSFGHRLTWWQPTKVYLKTQTDNSKLGEFITQHAMVTIQPAKDAELSIENGEVEVKSSEAGKHYGLFAPLETLENKISTLNSSVLKLETLSTRPALTTKQLAGYQDRLEKLLNQKVVFTIDGNEVKPTAADITKWLEVSKKANNTLDISVNSGKILEYINAISKNYIHPPKAQVVVSHEDGSTSVLIAGVNGTDVVEKDKTATRVADSLLSGGGVEEKLTVDYAEFKTVKAAAYDKWIEVDTTNKRMYTYEKDKLVKTFLVSAGAPKTPTVTGQYSIYAKYDQQDMRGLNVDGSSYFQPNVAWVSYFYADYAIHGNYWRPLDYFGNVNSSHGCVGVVNKDAQWVYSWAPIGTPVIVHT